MRHPDTYHGASGATIPPPTAIERSASIMTGVLLLGNSNDDPSFGAPFGEGFRIVQSAIAERARQPVEAHFVTAFPNAGLPAFAERLLARHNPAIVILHCSGYLVGPVLLEARFHRLMDGAYLSRFIAARTRLRRALGLSASVGSEIGGDRRRYLYAWGRDLLLALGAGQTGAGVGEIAGVYEAVIRTLARHEDVVLLVRGPTWNAQPGRFSRQQPAMNARLAQLDQLVAAASRASRTPFTSILDQGGADPRAFMLADGFHLNERGHQAMAARELAELAPFLT